MSLLVGSAEDWGEGAEELDGAGWSKCSVLRLICTLLTMDHDLLPSPSGECWRPLVQGLLENGPSQRWLQQVSMQKQSQLYDFISSFLEFSVLGI